MIHSITPRPTTPDDGAIFNERESVLQYNIDIDYSVKDTLKTFKEEVLDELYAQYSLHGNMPVMFSGGMDSTFIVRSLIELGIKPKTLSFSFSTDNSDYESQLVKRRCAEHGLDDPEFIYIDCDGFANHCRYLNEERNIKYSIIHGYLVDYFLSKTGDLKFLSGMSCEYKLRDNNIIMMPLPYKVKGNNLIGFWVFPLIGLFFHILNTNSLLIIIKKDSKDFEPEYGYVVCQGFDLHGLLS